MAAARCSTCSKNYPPNTRRCNRCDGELSYMYNAEVDSDWETTPEEPLKPSASEQKVYDWRLLRIMDAGAGLQHAEILARSKADLHKVCQTLRAGCTPLKAVAIFGDD